MGNGLPLGVHGLALVWCGLVVARHGFAVVWCLSAVLGCGLAVAGHDFAVVCCGLAIFGKGLVSSRVWFCSSRGHDLAVAGSGSASGVTGHGLAVEGHGSTIFGRCSAVASIFNIKIMHFCISQIPPSMSM